MKDVSRSTHTRLVPVLLLSALLATVSASGCGDSATVPNGPPTVSNVQVTNVDTETIGIQYEISDPEGDDHRLFFEVCEAQNGGTSQCGTALEGPGGDGAALVPTLPPGEKVTHVFHWRVGCGRFVGSERVDSQVSTEYVARVYVDGRKGEAAASSSFVLNDLSFDTIPDCTSSQ